MVRVIAFFVGLAFAGVLLISLIIGVVGFLNNPPADLPEAKFYEEPRELHLASNGPFGKFDREQVQRGFQVYKEVCAACHSLKLVAFHDLSALGYNEAEVKAIANQWSTEAPSINPDTGEPATRKALPSDYFPSPYANETAGRAANNNALPPDLSLMTKAREDGAAYVYSLLTGYRAQPAALIKQFPAAKTPPGLHYNPYFANLNIAMPPPLTSEGQVTYADGTRPTVDQMAKDVAAFLVWTAEPKLENRHRAGLVTVIFLLFATVLGYLAYQQIWAEAKRKVRVTGPLDAANQAKSRAAKNDAGIAG
ncbi:MAG: cytochrome c1 [Sphingomicrobium sp.]